MLKKKINFNFCSLTQATIIKFSESGKKKKDIVVGEGLLENKGFIVREDDEGWKGPKFIMHIYVSVK